MNHRGQDEMQVGVAAGHPEALMMLVSGLPDLDSDFD
jgi:hypothetical protein